MYELIIILLIVMIIACFIFMLYHNHLMEYMTSLSNEAIQDVASVYNKNKLIVTDVVGTTGTLGGIKLSNGWSPTSDSNEISNDTNVYKTLMIVGNRSGGGNNRRIGLWDDVTVAGSLTANDSLTANGRNILNELTSLRNDLTNLQNNVNNNYIKKGAVSIMRSFCDNGSCGDKKYLDLNNLPLVDANAGGGYSKLVYLT